MSIPNYHPFFVHFTIGLIITSFGTFILAQILKSWLLLQKELFIVSRWCLWLGAIASALTVLSGFNAYSETSHNTSLYCAMIIHCNWSLIAYVAFLCMAVISFTSYIKDKSTGKLFALGMLIISVLVIIAGFYGDKFRHIKNLCSSKRNIASKFQQFNNLAVDNIKTLK